MTTPDLLRKVAEATKAEMIDMSRDLRNPAYIDIDAIVARVLAENAPPVKYGCHCDLENMPPGTQPDDCVFDNGDVDDCIYAVKLQREGKGKLACEFWRPIDTPPVQAEHAEVLDAPDSPGWWWARWRGATDGEPRAWSAVQCLDTGLSTMVAYIAGSEFPHSLGRFDRWQRIVPPC